MIRIGSPLAGWVTPLDSVPDPVFAERMLGDGVAVDPIEGRLVAPAAGVVTSVHAARHAVTLEVDGGPVLLMHVGLDTVALGGEGFVAQVRDGQRVAAGDTLVLFDLDLLARRARSLVTPAILTNGEQFRIVSTAAEGRIASGDPLLTLEPTGTASDARVTSDAAASRSLRLLLAHGLHARPAARLAKAIAGLDAQAELVAADARAASVRSPVAMLGLGLRHGDDVSIRASGPDAARAVTAIAELLDSGMGELLPLPTKVPEVQASASLPTEVPHELRGISAVPGVAIGPAWRLRQDEIAVAETADDPEAERRALIAARDRVRSALEAETAAGGTAASIAEAHLAMLDDPMLDEAARASIGDGKSAAFAWRQAIREFAAPLHASIDARFAERLDDLIDLERRLVGEIIGKPSASAAPPRSSVVIAGTIYPSQLQALADAQVAGIATSDGGSTSHAAIIAAGLGLPMLVGLGPSLALVEDGTPLILGGNRLTIAPDAATLARAREEAAARRERRAAAEARAHELAVTSDGTRIEVFANLGSVVEAASAVDQGAEGCGLLRTEFLFLDRAAPPDEAEQRHAYQAIADELGERPLIVRTLDIGADKPAPWLPMDAEDNPALGLRGIRLQLARTDLLETQLRALLAVRAHGPLQIMLPMVTGVAEVRATKAVLDRLSTEMAVEPPALGIMVETPAAALSSAALASEAAFFSIGTNDLSQYALARDRTNPAVASGLDGLDPALLRLIGETVRGANAHGRVTGVCGGLAADPEAVPILVGLGVTELSVPLGAIAETKMIVRGLDLQRCRQLASDALAAPDADAVRALAAAFVEQRA